MLSKCVLSWLQIKSAKQRDCNSSVDVVKSVKRESIRLIQKQNSSILTYSTSVIMFWWMYRDNYRSSCRGSARGNCCGISATSDVSSSRSQRLFVGRRRRRDSTLDRQFTCLTCHRLSGGSSSCRQKDQRDARLPDSGILPLTCLSTSKLVFWRGLVVQWLGREVIET